MNGSFDTKIQKKIAAERLRAEIIKRKTEAATNLLKEFVEVFTKTEKKAYKENLMPFFGTSESVGAYISETLCKFEERPADKWAEAFKYLNEQGTKITVLKEGSESVLIPPEKILAQQLESIIIIR